MWHDGVSNAYAGDVALGGPNLKLEFLDSHASAPPRRKAPRHPKDNVSKLRTGGRFDSYILFMGNG